MEEQESTYSFGSRVILYSFLEERITSGNATAAKERRVELLDFEIWIFNLETNCREDQQVGCSTCPVCHWSVSDHQDPKILSLN
jgi:hypothetical protein